MGRNEPKRYLIGDSLALPTRSIAANRSLKNRARNGLMVPRLAVREKDLDKPTEGHGHNALAAWPRSLRSEVTLREALGFPPKQEKEPTVSLCAAHVLAEE